MIPFFPFLPSLPMIVSLSASLEARTEDPSKNVTAKYRTPNLCGAAPVKWPFRPLLLLDLLWLFLRDPESEKLKRARNNPPNFYSSLSFPFPVLSCPVLVLSFPFLSSFAPQLKRFPLLLSLFKYFSTKKNGVFVGCCSGCLLYYSLDRGSTPVPLAKRFR